MHAQNFFLEHVYHDLHWFSIWKTVVFQHVFHHQFVKQLGLQVGIQGSKLLWLQATENPNPQQKNNVFMETDHFPRKLSIFMDVCRGLLDCLGRKQARHGMISIHGCQGSTTLMVLTDVFNRFYD